MFRALHISLPSSYSRNAEADFKTWDINQSMNHAGIAPFLHCKKNSGTIWNEKYQIGIDLSKIHFKVQFGYSQVYNLYSHDFNC